MKRKLLFVAALVASALGFNVSAQTDVTSTYITNADFEDTYTIKTTNQAGDPNERYIFEPNGWTVVHTNPNENDLTCLLSTDKQANSFDGLTMNHAGSQTYWTRLRWGGQTWKPANEGGTTGSPTTLELQQAITLPNGVYRLSADIFCYYQGTEENNHVYLKADGRQVEPAINHEKNDAKWETKSLIITSSGSTEHTIGLHTAHNWNNGGETLSAFDNVRLEKFDIDAEHPFDLSPIFESKLGTSNWTNNGANNAGPHTNGGVDMVERYYNQHYTGEVSRWTLGNLPAGKYDVEVYCQAHCADWECSAIPEAADAIDRTILSANGVEIGIPIKNDKNLTEGPQVRTFADLEVTDGTLTVIVRNDQQGANWLTFEIKSITYKGSDVEEAKAIYDAAKDAAVAARDNGDYATITGLERTNLINAINAEVEYDTDAYLNAANALTVATAEFNTTTIGNYALLATEKTKAAALGMTSEAINTAASTTKTGLRALQDLKEAEYSFVTTEYPYSVELSSDWTSTGTNTSAAVFSNEHWSGTTHNYMNQNDTGGQGWNANSWTIDFNQDVLLPAGNYVFKVAGRQASGDQVNTSLIVTNASTDAELGTVSDFPRSNSSRGINKSGATSFNEDNSAYANNGNGFGWEWRYVKFTLASETTVNIAIHSVATANHQWVSFGDYTLQTDNEDVEEMLAYNVAYRAATAARDNSTYDNVTGDEKTALLAAIALDPTVDPNTYASVTTALNTAHDAFVAAKTNYDAYALAKSYADAATAVALPYATTAKITAVATAKSASVTTSAAAATAAINITNETRAAYESNMLAENTATASNVTDVYLANADGNTADGWTGSFTVNEEPQTNFWTANGEPYTEADGNATNTYVDRNSMTTASFSQTITSLPAGHYIVSVTARAQASITSYQLKATNNASDVESANIPVIGNANGVFNRGWNVVTLAFEQKAAGTATIAIEASNAADFWMSFDRVRLINLDGADITISENDASGKAATNVDVTLTRTLKGGQWNGFSVPFGFTVAGSALEGAEVKQFASVSLNEITLADATEIVAGEPYLVKPASDIANPTFNGVNVTNPAEAVKGDGDYKFAAHLYATDLATDGSIAYVSTTDSSIKKLTSGSIKGLRAVFQIPTGGSVKALTLNFDDESTAIMSVDAEGNLVEDGIIYNLAGQRVSKTAKGLYIKNGKKVVVK